MAESPDSLIRDATTGLGQVSEIITISSSDWARVFKVTLEDGTKIAAKVPGPGHEHLVQAEEKMLQFLNQKTPGLFPEVKASAANVLLLDFIENDGAKGAGGERQAGRNLAQLHSNTANQFGFEVDNVLGPCPPPNTMGDNWVDFFSQHRLMYMAGVAHKAGRINADMVGRIEKFCDHLGDYLPASPTPVLLHGDFWGGNILFNKGECAAFIDPAIYYGHAEVDLAFATLFGSVGDDFFAGYQETHKIEDGFFEARLDIYNLWPLLFHAYWFGGHYVGSVDGTLRKLGH